MSFWSLSIRSSLGSKYVMAITGAALILFVLAHMAGNLLLFLGPDAINAYAQKLQQLGPLLWVARLGLLVIFVVHLFMGLRLALLNKAARPVRYQYEDTVVASWASRYMLGTGIVVLLFLLYHLAHFTLGVTHEAHIGGGTVSYRELEQTYDPQTGKGLPAEATTAPSGLKASHRHDVYTMVIAGFRNPVIAGLYLAAMIALWLHLWHGVSSWFQSLGLGTAQENPLVAWAGPVVSTLVLIGNSSIVLAVLLGFVGPKSL